MRTSTAVITRADERHVNLSGVLSALSYALDLTDGNAPGHTLRSCAIGMRLAEAIGLNGADRSALLPRCCSSRMPGARVTRSQHQLRKVCRRMTNEVKRALKEIDWQRRPQAILNLFPLIAAGSSLGERCWRVVRLMASDPARGVSLIGGDPL